MKSVDRIVCLIWLLMLYGICNCIEYIYIYNFLRSVLVSVLYAKDPPSRGVPWAGGSSAQTFNGEYECEPAVYN
jgi:hypothetical protein